MTYFIDTRFDEPDPLYGGSLLTVNPPGVSKVSGVKAFCHWTGHPFNYAAIGDGINDLELLEAASLSIAITDSHASHATTPTHTIPPPTQSGWAAVPTIVRSES